MIPPIGYWIMKGVLKLVLILLIPIFAFFYGLALTFATVITIIYFIFNKHNLNTSWIKTTYTDGKPDGERLSFIDKEYLVEIFDWIIFDWR